MSNLAKILALFALSSGAFACSKPAKPKPYYIDKIQLADSTLQGNPALPVSTAELHSLAQDAFMRSGRFVPLAASTKPRPPDLKALRAKVDVAFTRETLEEGGSSKAEVGVVLELKRPGEVDRFQASGLGRVSFPVADSAQRLVSFRKALDLALDEVAKSSAIQLDSVGKSDDALIADLSNPDPRVRDTAVRLIADRKPKAAVPALIERLKDTDRDVAMKAVGALGSIGDPKAVPALIEMSQTRDPQFVVALIGVVAQLGGPDAEAFLFTVASGHAEEAVRKAAQEAQEQLAKKSAGDTNETRDSAPAQPPDATR
ncbi:MAG: HEAT repeat domain-containing protein [Myxococcales bacterium]